MYAPRAGRRAHAAALVSLLLGAAMLASLPESVGAAAGTVTSERLAGVDRYGTAADIADAYVRERDARGVTVDTAILASGADQHFGYAVVSPTLSQRHDAPLLLTGGEALPPATAGFLTRHGVSRVLIVGGTDTVPDSVEEAVKALGISDVERVFAGDVYRTSVAVAERAGTVPGLPGSYPGRGRTALVATGEVFADALATGALAYRGAHPVLLTPSDSLHAAAAEFLRRSGTEHVIVVGGPAAVGAQVSDAIEDLGITVERIWGSDRFATAVHIAEVLLGADQPYSCFDGSELGLANGLRSPDAIASGPLLGERCAALLLTDQQQLSEGNRSFLASDDYADGGAQSNLRLAVFGGTAAVSASAAASATDTASLRQASARITAVEGRCHFTVRFDELVLASDAGDVQNYRVGGSSPDGGYVDSGHDEVTREVTVVLAGATQPFAAAVPAGCDTPLQGRQQLEIAGGVIRTADERRTVQRTSGSAAADRAPPRITVTAIEGADIVWFDANEPLRLVTGAIEFERRGSAPMSVTALADVTAGARRFEVPVPGAFGNALQSGDRVTLTAGAVRDLAGNRSRATFASARRDPTAPRVSRVAVSAPQGRSGARIDLGGMTVVAKPDGSAYGAVGNTWTLEIDVMTDWVADRVSEMVVASGARRVTARLPAQRTLDRIVADFNRDRQFSRYFVAQLDGNGQVSFGADFGPASLSGGTSTVDLTVRWTEPVLGCDVGAGAVLPGFLELDFDADGDYDYFLDGHGAASWGVSFVDAPDGNPAINIGAATCDSSIDTLPGTLVARLSSADRSVLPSLRSVLFVRQGAATDRIGNIAANQRFSGFSRP